MKRWLESDPGDPGVPNFLQYICRYASRGRYRAYNVELGRYGEYSVLGVSLEKDRAVRRNSRFTVIVVSDDTYSPAFESVQLLDFLLPVAVKGYHGPRFKKIGELSGDTEEEDGE